MRLPEVRENYVFQDGHQLIIGFIDGAIPGSRM